MYNRDKPDLNSLAHYGKKGMKWGVINEDDISGGGRGGSDRSVGSSKVIALSAKKRNSQELNAEILRQNKYAAVANIPTKSNSKKEPSPEEIAARREQIKKVALGVGIGLTVAAGAVVYARNKTMVDNALKASLIKLQNKKPTDLENGLNEKLDDVEKLGKKVTEFEKLGLTRADYNTYKACGLKVDNPHDPVINNWVANWLSSDIHRYDAISEDAYKTLDDKDLTLKAGQTFHRVTTNGKEILRNNAYVSFEPDDVNRYQAFLPAMWKVNGQEEKQVYLMSMRAISDIKSPSRKARIDILKDMLDTDPSFALDCGYDKLGSDSTHNHALKIYNQLATGLVNRDSPITQKYLATVQSRGYNALVDDNDAGRLAKTPMILLDTANTIRQNGMQALTKDNLRAAAQAVVPMDSESIQSLNGLVKDAGFNKSAYLDYARKFTQSMA